MKWLPRSKKHWIIIILLVLAAGGAGFYIVQSGKDDKVVEDNSTPKETKVTDIIAALKTDTSYTSFNDFLGALDISAKIVPNQAGAAPKLIVFAPNKAAFEKDGAAQLANIPEALKDELRLYHMALLYPAADGTGPSLELSEGEKITTIVGRELTVRKKGSRFVLVDAKGNEALVNASYTSDDQGYRLYTIDSVLLLQ